MADTGMFQPLNEITHKAPNTDLLLSVIAVIVQKSCQKNKTSV